MANTNMNNSTMWSIDPNPSTTFSVFISLLAAVKKTEQFIWNAAFISSMYLGLGVLQFRYYSSWEIVVQSTLQTFLLSLREISVFFVKICWVAPKYISNKLSYLL